MPNRTRRSTTTRNLIMMMLGLLALTAGTGAVDVAVAQETVTAGPVPTDADPAALARRAEALAANRSRWYEAALLFRVSASLREEGDPEAARSLRRSAQLFASLGEHRLAGEALEAAGEAALRARDVHQAADAYVDAMVTARARGATADARRLERIVRRLAGSDQLTASERDRILARLRRSE